MKITLDEKSSFVSIPELYDNISMKINGKKANHYDCRKVRVGEAIHSAIERYYGMQFDYMDDNDLKGNVFLLWVTYGPKVSLEGYEVEVDDGWCEF